MKRKESLFDDEQRNALFSHVAAESLLPQDIRNGFGGNGSKTIGGVEAGRMHKTKRESSCNFHTDPKNGTWSNYEQGVWYAFIGEDKIHQHYFDQSDEDSEYTRKEEDESPNFLRTKMLQGASPDSVAVNVVDHDQDELARYGGVFYGRCSTESFVQRYEQLSPLLVLIRDCHISAILGFCWSDQTRIPLGIWKRELGCLNTVFSALHDPTVAGRRSRVIPKLADPHCNNFFQQIGRASCRERV